MNMSWLDKVMAGYGKRAETANTTALEDYTTKLKALTYDEDIAKELAPIFAKLHGTEGFNKVWELIETKEQQIAAISGGEWFKQESDSNTDEDKASGSESEKEQPLTAEQILENKYKQS